MDVKLEFSDEQCNELLSRIGYKIETVKLYFYKSDDPYGKKQDFVGYEWKVCYVGEKPKELCKENPLLEECRDYLFHNVAQEVISKWLFKIMLNHLPFCNYRD